MHERILEWVTFHGIGQYWKHPHEASLVLRFCRLERIVHSQHGSHRAVLDKCLYEINSALRFRRIKTGGEARVLYLVSVWRRPRVLDNDVRALPLVRRQLIVQRTH